MLSSTVLVIVSGLLASAAPTQLDVPRIAGFTNAIADVTPDAGWIILDCDPHSLEQEIRLVCQHDDSDASACAHVFEHGGAEGKVVRLPESCSSGRFARITQATVATDQSIPHPMTATILRRDGLVPQVYSFKLSFMATDTATVGEMNSRSVGPRDHLDSDFDPYHFDYLKGAEDYIRKVTHNNDRVGSAVDSAKDYLDKAKTSFTQAEWIKAAGPNPVEKILPGAKDVGQAIVGGIAAAVDKGKAKVESKLKGI